MWTDYHGKLQILLVKKAVSWRPQVLSHVNLVLQDSGVINLSDTDSEADTPFTKPQKIEKRGYTPSQVYIVACCQAGQSAFMCTR